MIALVGSEGSMGKRYQAILRHLKEDFIALDKASMPEEEIISRASECDRILICTPTDTHVRYLRALLPTRKPILCEKPVTKNLEELEELHAECARNGWQYQMVMQYLELEISREPNRWSFYNYFRHGNDGLVWDCMQIVALAQGDIALGETSPYWDCVINGRKLNIADMDGAYVRHIHRWLSPGAAVNCMDDILAVHRKVSNYKETHDAN